MSLIHVLFHEYYLVLILKFDFTYIMLDQSYPIDDENSLTMVLLKKEKELQDLSKMRINQLQDQLIFKEKTIFDLECQIRRLSEDNSYKTQLVTQRDSEIIELENQISIMDQESCAMNEIISNLKSENGKLHERLSTIENINTNLRVSHSNLSDVDKRLQEAFSLNNKLNYDLQIVTDKLKNIEMLYEEQVSENQQRKEDTNAKLILIQQLTRDKDFIETELKELKNKNNSLKDKYEREALALREQFLNELQQTKAQREANNEQSNFAAKVQCDKFQAQIKGLLDDNKKLNHQVEHYQNLILDKEKKSNQEIYVLKKQVNETNLLVEDLSSKVRAKDMEIVSIKDMVDHWKNLATNRADELFQIKQIQIRSEEKADGYLKELDAFKNKGFDEIQRLQIEIEKLLREKRTRVDQEMNEGKTISRYKEEINRLNDIVSIKDKENSKMTDLITDTLQYKQTEKSHCDRSYSNPRISPNQPPNRSKIYQVKSALDQKFFKY